MCILRGLSMLKLKMVKYTFSDTAINLVCLWNSCTIMPRQSSTKLTPGRSLRLKDTSYDVLKKQKNGLRINREVYLVDGISGHAMRGKIMAIMGPSGASESDDAVLTVIQARIIAILHFWIIVICFCAITYASFIILCVSFINSTAVVIAATALVFLKSLQISATKEPFEALMIKERNGAEEDKKIDKHHSTTSGAPKSKWRVIIEDVLWIDGYSIENFCFSICLLLAWEALYRLFFYVLHWFYPQSRRK